LETVRVKHKGLVTIPAEIRKRHGIAEGDLLQITEEKGAIVLKSKRLSEPGRPVGKKEQKKILKELETLSEKWC